MPLLFVLLSAGCVLLVGACQDAAAPGVEDPGPPADGAVADSGQDAGQDADVADGGDDGGMPDGGEADAAPPPKCEVTAPTACAEPAPHFADILPVLEEHCLTCHDGASGPWPLTDWGHVAAWQMDVRSAMLSCSMPPPAEGLWMPREDRETLLMWVRCGALE